MVRVLPIVVILAVAACSKGTPAQASTDAKAATAAATPAAAAQAAPAPVKAVPTQLPDVMATVNGESISKADFEKAIKNLEGRAGGPVPSDQRDRVFRGLLDQLVGYKLLVQESKTQKVVVADADVDQRLNTIRQQFPTEEAFKQTLQQQNLSVDQIKSDARQDIAVAKVIESAIKDKVTAAPADIEAFYKSNPQSFQAPERVKASHILIGVPRGADAATKAKAKEKAESVLKEVKAGKDFAELAKQHSEDPGSGKNGGDLGYFQPGQMVGPFNDVAFSLKPGTTSELVETEFGFHIIKVEDKQAGRTVPLDEARPRIQQYLEDQNRQKETEAFVNALRAKGKVEIFI